MTNFFSINQKTKLLFNGGCLIKKVKTFPDDLRPYRGAYLLKKNKQLVYVNAQAQKEEVFLAGCELMKLESDNLSDLSCVFDQMQGRFALALIDDDIVFFDKLLKYHPENVAQYGPRFLNADKDCLLPLFDEMEGNSHRDLGMEEVILLRNVLPLYGVKPFNLPQSLVTTLGNIQKDASQKEDFIVLNRTQRQELFLMHENAPDHNMKTFVHFFRLKEALRREVFPPDYQRYPIVLRHVCQFLDAAINFVLDVLDLARIAAQSAVSLVSFLPRLLETVLLQQATRLACPRSIDEYEEITDTYRWMKRRALNREFSLNGPTFHYDFPVGFDIDSKHVSLVVNALHEAWKQDDLSLKERCLRVSFFLLALPITLSHGTLGLTFVVMENAVIACRAGLNAMLNWPLPIYETCRFSNKRVLDDSRIDPPPFMESIRMR